MRHIQPRKVRLLALCAALMGYAMASSAAEPIVLYYDVFPPFKMKLKDGAVGGLALTPVREAFAKAGVAVEWQEVPNLRQKLLVQRSTGSVCAVGIYRTDIRHTVGKISAPVFRNLPLEVLLAKGLPTKTHAQDLKALFADGSKMVVLLRGRSYGEYVDGLISNAHAKLDYANDVVSLIKMLDMNHGDATVLEPETINYHRAMSAAGAESLENYQPKDSPRGDFRYMFCSQNFPDDLLGRINRLLEDGRKTRP